MADFVMPSLGADMERGILSEWLVKPGQEVKRGDLIAVVETDKGAIEVECFTPGTVSALLVEEGADVPVGTVLAILDDGAAPAAVAQPPGPARSAPAPVAPAPAPVASPPVTPAPASTAPEPTPAPDLAPSSPAAPARGRASPWARHLAAERHLDLATLTGTGPGGAIVGADIPAVAPEPPRKKPAGADADAMRRAVAKAMERSKREIPHYYLGTEVDMAPALAWLERTNASLPPPERLLSAVLLIRATALAVARVPQVNGFWTDGRLEVADAVHLGVAISLRGGGLVSPALHHADQLDLHGLMRGLDDLVKRARRGRLRGSEMMDATLTMTSMGDRGVSDIQGVIYPPQVAIVGFGRAVERPWVVDGKVVPRPVMRATLAGDHRAHDGHAGGLYLAEIQRLLENPELLS